MLPSYLIITNVQVIYMMKLQIIEFFELFLAFLQPSWMMSHNQITSNSSNSNRQVDLRTGRERLPHAHFKSEPEYYQWDLDDSEVQEIGAVLLGVDSNNSSLGEEEDEEDLVEEQEQENEHIAAAPERVGEASESSGLGASFELLLQRHNRTKL